jgi:hypothetical protein
MTDKNISDVLDFYEQHLARSTSHHPCVIHLRTMIPKMRTFIEEGRRDKVMRWLGFMQGAFWTLEWFTLEELKQHNTA